MSKRTRTSKIEKWIKKGRDSGVGSEYKPWLKIQDVASMGCSTRLKGIKTNRQHEFLSDLERNYFYLNEYSDFVVDIREQFLLLPLEETIVIADELGIGHALLERATENLPSKRPDIDEVLAQIGYWKQVLNDEGLVRAENNLELYEQIPNQHVPSEYIYRELNQMYEILSKLINEHFLYKESIGVIDSIVEIKRARIENYFILDNKDKFSIFRPSLLRYTDDKWYLNTGEVDEKALERESISLSKSKKNILESLFEQVNPKNKMYEVIDSENDILLQTKF